MFSWPHLQSNWGLLSERSAVGLSAMWEKVAVIWGCFYSLNVSGRNCQVVEFSRMSIFEVTVVMLIGIAKES